MRSFAITICTLTLGSMALAPVAALAQDLPPGPGAALVANACSGCHGVDTVTSARNNLDGWRSTVQQMVGSGASLSDAEAETVSQYLATNFGFTPPPAAAAAPAAPAPTGAGVEPAAPGAPAAAPATPPADAATPPVQTPPAQ